MPRPAPMRDVLLDQTIAMVAAKGLENISLRAIAAGAGCTTAVIFQQYDGKAALLAATLDRALQRDAAAHAAILRDAEGLATGHAGLSDLLASYITVRSAQPVPRFWSEVLFKSRQLAGSTSALERWHQMRTAFWGKVLGSPDDLLAAILAAYAAMEEVYAYPLRNDVQYQLLLRETARALTERSFATSDRPDTSLSVSAMLDKAPLPSSSSPSSEFAMREQLLDLAANSIIEDGIGTISQRDLADQAGVSSSMVAYHFGDMKTLINEAVWRALVRGIPNELDPTRTEAAVPFSMDAWFETLNTHVRPRSNADAAGFYTGFARITGQACLLADSRPSLMPLVHHLRALEGWGTYRVGRSIEPAGPGVGREHAAAFGIWIKAEAVLREAGLSDPSTGSAHIAAVAARILLPGI